MKTLILIGLLACITGNMAFAQAKAKKTAKSHSGPITNKPAAVTDPGAAVYAQYCLACHQADGGGVPSLNPPLRGTDWVLGDKNKLITVLLKGLQNAEVNGETYDNAMPAHDFLTDQQIADVLTYIRKSFGNKAEAVRIEEVTALRK